MHPLHPWFRDGTIIAIQSLGQESKTDDRLGCSSFRFYISNNLMGNLVIVLFYNKKISFLNPNPPLVSFVQYWNRGELFSATPFRHLTF